MNPTYRDAFIRSPYRDACAEWPVPQSRAAKTPPLTATPAIPGTPALVGAYDPFASPAAARKAMSHLTHGWLRVLDTDTHDTLDTLGSECARQVRNAWIRNPASPPPPASTCADPPSRHSSPCRGGS